MTGCLGSQRRAPAMSQQRAVVAGALRALLARAGAQGAIAPALWSQIAQVAYPGTISERQERRGARSAKKQLLVIWGRSTMW